MVHAFADCELDEELFQLRRKGKVVKIREWVLDKKVPLADVTKLRNSVDPEHWATMREWIASHNVSFA